MISIHRNCETKKLEIMINSDNDARYITYDDANNSTHLNQMIGSCAKAMGLDWDQACEEFDSMWFKLLKLSKERKRRMQLILPKDLLEKSCDSLEFVYFTLVADGVLTLHEIFWLDFYCKKNKLL